MRLAGWFFLIALIGVVLAINIILILNRERIRLYFEKRKTKAPAEPQKTAAPEPSVSKVFSHLKHARKIDFWLPEIDQYRQLGNEMDRLESLRSKKEQE